MKNALNLARWLRRRRDRRMLLSMDDRMLSDVGIGRSQIDLYISSARGR